jgi:HD-GYP domain-containing protein (c-di-GMP phosphodiesterase class II)
VRVLDGRSFQFVQRIVWRYPPMSNTGFIPVSVATLYPTEGLGVDLYIRPQGYDEPILYCARTLNVKQDDLWRLEDSGVTRLYIRRDERRTYQQFLRQHLDGWLRDPAQPMKARTAMLNEVVRDVLSESFADGRTETIVGKAGELGQRAAELLTSEPVVFQDVVRVLHHDYTTFTHSANVCYYSVLLGAMLDFSHSDLVQIAIGALLHDIGKLDINEQVLLKEGPLTELERRQIRKHPTSGFRKLSKRPELSQGQLLMSYQHHERIDGSGYPVGAVGEEIHPWARLCAVVDVYEALTSQRPYRQPLTPTTALAVMAKNSEKQFDQEMFSCWITIATPRSSS